MTREVLTSRAANNEVVGLPERHDVGRATDRITLPPRELFFSAEEQIATTYHEVSHYADLRIMPRFLACLLCVVR